jgi:23S rRNA (cytosine1962-C5)-methyltransferase
MIEDAYALLDSGGGQKLERFGTITMARPAAQAVWQRQHNDRRWEQADAVFTRDGTNQWIVAKALPKMWKASIAGITFKLMPTDFGHLGIFPEQRPIWHWIREVCQQWTASRSTPPHVLNLFAYSGGSTLAAAQGGAKVCHLDASRPTVAWARENAALNNLENAPIRWISDDVSKFLNREVRRGQRYDLIILDPPTFGRGPDGELFKIEEQIVPLLQQCRALLTDQPLGIFFSCHTPGFSPLLLQLLLEQALNGLSGTVTSGELTLTGDETATFPLPCGAFAKWCYHA